MKTLEVDGILYKVIGFSKQDHEVYIDLESEGVLKSFTIELLSYDPTTSHVSFKIDNAVYSCSIDATQGCDQHVYLKGHQLLARDVSKQLITSKESSESLYDPLVKSPMSGSVVRVLCEPGQVIKKSAPLVIIESMKMENEICSSSDGVVKTLFISPGDVVQPNQPLVELEKKGESNAASKISDGKASV